MCPMIILFASKPSLFIVSVPGKGLINSRLELETLESFSIPSPSPTQLMCCYSIWFDLIILFIGKEGLEANNYDH